MRRYYGGYSPLGCLFAFVIFCIVLFIKYIFTSGVLDTFWNWIEDTIHSPFFIICAVAFLIFIWYRFKDRI